MRYLIILLAVFLFGCAQTQTADISSTGLDFDGERYNFTLVFDAEDMTLDEMQATIEMLYERFGSHTLIQMWGEPFVVYCPTPDECMPMDGEIGIMAPDYQESL